MNRYRTISLVAAFAVGVLMLAATAQTASAGGPCVTYKNHRTLRPVCCCGPSHAVMLSAYDPVCCRCIEVPVCVPCGCNDCVCSKERGGLIARSVTSYRFSSGYRVQIVIGPRGNVVVHTFG